MIIISHVIYVAKDMSEKCEHGRIQGKLICLDCRKVFIELEAFQAREKKGRELELKECKEHKEEHNRQVKYLVDQARSQAFDDCIDIIIEWFNLHEDNICISHQQHWICPATGLKSMILEKLKEKRG